MITNRQAGFARKVIHQIDGIATYLVKNGMQQLDLGIALELKKGAARNKATRIEIKPDGHTALHVAFVRGSECPYKIISVHSQVLWELLPSLLYAEAGISTGPKDKEGGAGAFKTSKW